MDCTLLIDKRVNDMSFSIKGAHGLNTDSLQGGIWHFIDLPCGGSVYYDDVKVL